MAFLGKEYFDKMGGKFEKGALYLFVFGAMFGLLSYLFTLGLPLGLLGVGLTAAFISESIRELIKKGIRRGWANIKKVTKFFVKLLTKPFSKNKETKKFIVPEKISQNQKAKVILKAVDRLNVKKDDLENINNLNDYKRYLSENKPDLLNDAINEFKEEFSQEKVDKLYEKIEKKGVSKDFSEFRIEEAENLIENQKELKEKETFKKIFNEAKNTTGKYSYLLDDKSLKRKFASTLNSVIQDEIETQDEYEMDEIKTGIFDTNINTITKRTLNKLKPHLKEKVNEEEKNEKKNPERTL